MKVLLAQPRGFCAGVTRAIAIVERALAIYGAPIYVRHEIVHNRTVVNSLRERGAVFVDNLAEVPEGATVVFSAHGVPRAVSEEAERRASAFSTPPVRLLPRCIARLPACAPKDAPC
jgi:4-hydroxy-3-methylbut-2-enyl diphosphate reductase